MRELNEVERLAIAQALYKAAAELVDTRNPDSLRANVDRGYKELYERTGSKSFDVMVNGKQVGTYSIKFSKPKPEETRMDFEVIDYELLARYFIEYVSDEQCREFAEANLNLFANYAFNATGELMDGCDLVPIVSPAVEKQYMGGTLKIDPEQVREAMGEMLPRSIAGMLEAGNES